MEIYNQPFKQSLGFQLIEKLQSKQFSSFHFLVAYAKTSGVNRLLPSMNQFKTNGGSIKAIVGIDQSNTSYEALISLLSVCEELYIYHSEDFFRTFHVKAYHLGSSFEKNWIAIGSNNLTAGGLFSNYEACMTSSADESLTESFMEMFGRYSNLDFTCCKQADQGFIDLLFAKGYIQQEKALAKKSIDDEKSRQTRKSDEILFGRESMVVLKPFAEATPIAAPATLVSSDAAPVQFVHENLQSDMDYLIRQVPKAGDRSQQVHFTVDILRNYFKLSAGESLLLQQIDDIYSPHPIENRRVVQSSHNKNVRIEVGAAEVLNAKYPTDNEKRPVLIFKRVNPTMFEYMLLMDGDLGYDILNSRLLGLKWRHRSLRYEIVDADTMLTIWDDCPLI
jgi:HKD family nuclease